MRNVSLLLGLLAFWLVTGPIFAGTTDELIAADTAFSDLSAAKGSNAAFLSYLADDGILYGSGNRAPIYGKADAVKRFQTEGNGDPRTNKLTWTPEHAGASSDGTAGWTSGTWAFNGLDGKGAAFKLTGHYLTVWKKDAKKGWKVAADMGTVHKTGAP